MKKNTSQSVHEAVGSMFSGMRFFFKKNVTDRVGLDIFFSAFQAELTEKVRWSSV